MEGRTTEETVGGKDFKNFRSQLSDALAAGDKGSCFELLELDEDDV